MKNKYPVLFILLAKRLIKKRTFIVLLLMIPVTVLLISLVAQGESGVVRIVLVNEAKDSGAGSAGEAIKRLMKEESVFLFKESNDREEAVKMIEKGEADEVWIFPEGYKKRTYDITASLINKKDDAAHLVEVFLCEDNVMTQLSRLKLFGMLYSDLSFSLFENYISDVLKDDTEQAKLREIYGSDNGYRQIFLYGTDKDMGSGGQGGYLFTPVRGLLLIMILLCSLATAMYFRDDLDKGIFTWMPVGNRWVFEHLYLLTGLFYGAVTVFITFLFSVIIQEIKKELVLMFLFIPACCCFSSVVRKITRNLKILSTVIPILILLLMAACPVFVYIKELKFIQLLLPPFYYLMALNNADYFKYFVTYLILIIAVDVLLEKCSRCSG